MAEINFNYEGIDTVIQINLEDKMKDIIDKFLNKLGIIDNNNLYYLYNGDRINSNLKFNEIANDIDKNRMKMNVIVYKNNEELDSTNETISKDIICPTCKEDILIDIDEFKINFYDCKNNHYIDNESLDRFEKTQKIDLAKIKCDICNVNNKSNTHNNDFYICNTCNKNICPLCKSIHDQSHLIINYDDKNYICQKHNDPFIKYCKTCNENLCIICGSEHNNHFLLDLSDLLIDKNDLENVLKKLKNIINAFNNKINLIKDMLNKATTIMNIYYKINNNILGNYNINKRNYHKLMNLKHLKLKSEILINELNYVLKKDMTYKYITDIFSRRKKNFILFERPFKYILNYDEDNIRKKYEGEFLNDKPHGKGTLYFKNGDRYVGDFINDNMEGKGIFYYKNGSRYEGDFHNNKKGGKGIIYNGNPISFGYTKYDGNWKNGIKEGRGIIYYYNGDKYDGSWIKEKKDGKGIFYYKNGDRYEGDFKFDGKGGKGIFYYKNGERYEGYWTNDKITKGIIYFYNGYKFEGEFDVENTKNIHNYDYNYYYKHYTNQDNSRKYILRGKGNFYYDNGEKFKGEMKHYAYSGINLIYLFDIKLYFSEL